jgi:hypothetical protein
MTAEGPDIPKIISVDDHVVEPPDLWSTRLPARYADVGPRVVRDRAKFSFVGGVFSYEKGVPDGEWCDWWLYDQLVYPFPKLSAAVGFDDLDVTPTTFDEIRPGCWIQKDRLADMDANHVDASICFPNTLPASAADPSPSGTTRLALLCVRAYNDWMIDEMVQGDGGDGSSARHGAGTASAADECAFAQHGVSRHHVLGSPYPLGLCRSIRVVGPLFAACVGTGPCCASHRLVSVRARPGAVHRQLNTRSKRHGLAARRFIRQAGAVPQLVVASGGRSAGLPTCSNGWTSFGRRSDNSFGITSRPPTTTSRGQSTGASSTRPAATATASAWTPSVETDYPYRRSPARAVAEQICRARRDDETYMLCVHDHAFGLERYGIAVAGAMTTRGRAGRVPTMLVQDGRLLMVSFVAPSAERGRGGFHEESSRSQSRRDDSVGAILLRGEEGHSAWGTTSGLRQHASGKPAPAHTVLHTLHATEASDHPGRAWPSSRCTATPGPGATIARCDVVVAAEDASSRFASQRGTRGRRQSAVMWPLIAVRRRQVVPAHRRSDRGTEAARLSWS